MNLQVEAFFQSQEEVAADKERADQCLARSQRTLFSPSPIRGAAGYFSGLRVLAFGV